MQSVPSPASHRKIVDPILDTICRVRQKSRYIAFAAPHAGGSCGPGDLGFPAHRACPFSASSLGRGLPVLGVLARPRAAAFFSSSLGQGPPCRAQVIRLAHALPWPYRAGSAGPGSTGPPIGRPGPGPVRPRRPPRRRPASPSQAPVSGPAAGPGSTGPPIGRPGPGPVRPLPSAPATACLAIPGSGQRTRGRLALGPVSGPAAGFLWLRSADPRPARPGSGQRTRGSAPPWSGRHPLGPVSRPAAG
jgi:hypothetical protein